MSPEVARRLAELAAEFALAGRQVSQLDRLLAALARSEHASTTVKDPRRAVDVHVADSLSALALARVRNARAIADIGSGAGFPGLVLAAALPRAQVTLVESVGRRCASIRALAAAAGIENATAAAVRAEMWVAGHERHDLVTARAVGPLNLVCEYAAPLLEVGGTLLVWRGKRDLGEEEAAAVAANELGLAIEERVRTVPYAGCQDHHLHVYLKVRDTPARYPRRPGMARKRPLGSST
ncbi:MAG: 16S rRNA (guanine(527)-N(7))-methyltransferase RsmG [Solirubrobacteraceae bacterium]